MLVLNMRKRWISWPEAGVRLLLSPLTNIRRAELMEQATVDKVDPENPKRKPVPTFNQRTYQDLVADECVHGWEGMLQPESEEADAALVPLPYGRPAAREAMAIDHFNVFVFNTAQTMGLEVQKGDKAAGNG